MSLQTESSDNELNYLLKSMIQMSQNTFFLKSHLLIYKTWFYLNLKVMLYTHC